MSRFQVGDRVTCGTVGVPATVREVLADGAHVEYDDEPGVLYPVAEDAIDDLPMPHVTDPSEPGRQAAIAAVDNDPNHPAHPCHW
jgi:hypothetical protein